MARIVEQRDTSALPPGTAVCLGAFDGMHIGHQALLSRAKALGEHLGMVTFDPHPQQVLAPERAPALLQTPVQRRRVCAALGVDHLVLLPFDREVARMSAEAFARTVLVEGLRPRAVVVGEDFRFGRGREGDGAMLAELLAPAGIEVARVPAVPMPESAWLPDTDPSHKLGATAVRDAVRAGQVERAGAMLGRWHSVPGTVVHGARRGRTIGFPTANISAPGGFLPPSGVYAGVLVVWSPDGLHAGKAWPAAANLGTNPTFQDQAGGAPPLSLEAHVIDQELGDGLYGLEVELSFVARLRDEQRFDGPAALVAQLRRDVAAARERIDPDALARVITPRRIVTTADPIASATLARLYLTQGHGARARAILDEVLARDPYDGDALALRARLTIRPRLSAAVEDDALTLRWQGVTSPDDVHLVVCVLGGDARIPRRWITSRPCTSAFGRHHLPLPWARGVLVAALGRVDARGFAPQVVAEPLGWG